MKLLSDGCSVYVLVFGNVFSSPLSIDYIYDLKGRKAKPGKVPRPAEVGSNGKRYLEMLRS